jgi:hypothetical protein
MKSRTKKLESKRARNQERANRRVVGRCFLCGRPLMGKEVRGPGAIAKRIEGPKGVRDWACKHHPGVDHGPKHMGRRR